MPDISIGSFATFADYFFDNLFVDLHIQSSIQDAQDGVSKVRYQVHSALHTLEEAEGALGVPIVPVEQDGGALCDAMLGEGTPEPRSGQGAAGGEEYYTYNQSRNRRSGG